MAKFRLSLFLSYISNMFRSKGGAFHLGLVGAAICAAVAPLFVGAQAVGSQLKSYNYSDEGLLVRFRDDIDATIAFQCQDYDQDGRP